MNRRIIQTILAIALTLVTALGSMPLALAQGYSTYGPYPATPGSWNGTVAPVQPYVPSNLPNGLPATTQISPNYIGNGHTTSNYGDYRNPSSNYQVPTYTGQSLTYRPNSQTYNGSYASNQYGGRGFNPMGLIIGGGVLGAGALAVGARSLSRGGLGRGLGGSGGGVNGNYQKNMEESDKRRKKQEEKIQKELKEAHETDLKRKGIYPTSAQAPSSINRSQAAPFSQSSQTSRKVKDSEDLEGDVLPASATQKLDF
ncbi:hypothetical protein BH11CYA1_BH11CYA1_21340 [soil metagenome]